MKKGIVRSLLPLMGGIMFWGCGSKAATGEMVAEDRVSELRVRELALPEVPATISDPSERAGYAVEHFWDALEPTRHSESLDTAFMEQTFANFIGLLPYASEESRERAADAFVAKLGGDSAVYDLGVHIARHYLDDPNSPMRNEELYLPFLRIFAEDSRLSEEKRARSAFRLEQALKNRPGTRAANFRLVTRDGRTTTLLQELTDTTLVFFYDYDCEHCMATVGRLTDPAVGVRYPVMAVEVTEDREGWEATKGGMPTEWMVTFATDALDGESYYFPALPSIYLLEPDGEVIVKDASLFGNIPGDPG